MSETELTEKKKNGRPTVYQESMCLIAEKAARLGATHDEIAEMLNIDRATLYRWRNQHQKFCDAIKIGKEEFDDRIEHALAHRALGYSHPSEEIKVVEGQIVRVETIKHYPPDATAMIFWLKNRRPKEWRDRREVEVSGKIPIKIEKGDEDI